jgi:thiol-disulfide isomerase/thioredoxin
MVNAQTVIEQPKVGMSTTFSFWINKIELRDDATVLFCHVVNPPKSWFQISSDNYLLPVGTKDTLHVISAEGITLNEHYTMTSSGNVDFKLFYPKVPSSVKYLDFSGPGDETWSIYDIQIKPRKHESKIPEELTGNWFRKDNAQWEVSLMKSMAVYNSKVWEYGKYRRKKGILTLKNGKNSIKLYTKTEDSGSIRIGESPEKLAGYTNAPDETAIPVDNEDFKEPVFKRDTAVYCGIIKNFCKRYPRRTGIIYVNDILSGGRIPYTYKINEDGYYEAKIPMTNPQEVIVKSPLGGSQMNVFLEPGKKTFEMIDKSGKQKRLYMGDNARINSDLIRIKTIDSFSFPEMIDKITDFSPEQYLLFCENSFIKDQNKLKEYAEKSRISNKAYKLLDMQQNYRFAINALSYQSYFTGAYRTKNKIPNTQRDIPVKPATPDKNYYSFLTKELVNNPFGVMVSDYGSFISRLKILEILPPTVPKPYTLPEIAADIEKSGIKLTTQERDLVQKMAELDIPETKKMENDFQEKYGKQFFEFLQKYKNNKGQVFRDQGFQFTEEEKNLLEARKEFDEHPLMQRKKAFLTENRDQISQFNNNHQSLINGLLLEKLSDERKEKLEKLFEIKSGLAVEIMSAQDIVQQIQRDMLPLTDQTLKIKLDKFTMPFICDYLKIKNDEMKVKVDANKLLPKDIKGAVIRKVPKTSSDKVFDAIVSNYKGKVVFVDFWATWCGPCRAGIERIKPLKEELSKENIAFVYISNQSSPEEIYNNMVAGIKGDHFRLTTDEFNVLADRFKISGIPHYMLVGKDGRIINEHLMYYDNSVLKNLLLRYVKE